MRLNRIFRKEFFITLFIKQNKWHRYNVLRHTLMVVYYAIKAKEYKMITAGFLHDIGKPILAFQRESDKLTGEYSFTNHEEIGYQLIKKVPFISDYTKRLVRHHFLLRGMESSKRKGHNGRYRRMRRKYDSLDSNFREDLKIFLEFDDRAKR